MSKYVISEPQFLKIFDKMFRKDFEKLSRETHPKYEGMVFWLDEYDLPILAYVSYINTLKVNNQLRLKHSSTFDLSLSEDLGRLDSPQTRWRWVLLVNKLA